MAVPILQTAGALAAGTTSPMNVPWPSGVVSHDLVVLHTMIENGGDTPTTPGGFSLAFGPDPIDVGDERSWVYLKDAAGGESGNLSLAFSDAADGVGARMYRISGANATPDVNGSNIASSSDEFWHAEITTLTDDSLVVALTAFGNAVNTAAGPFTGGSGGTWVESVADASGGTLRMQIQTLNKTTAGVVSGGRYSMAPLPGSGFSCRIFALKPGGSTVITTKVGRGILGRK